MNISHGLSYCYMTRAPIPETSRFGMNDGRMNGSSEQLIGSESDALHGSCEQLNGCESDALNGCQDIL